MNEAKHTPGPWKANDARNQDGTRDIYYVGQPVPWKIASGCSTVQNARLIAAAPDLLEALEALHACHRAFSGNGNWTMLDDDARAMAEKTIAKAKRD